MPQLLTLPYAVPLSALGTLLPGAKLSFFQTGTSTPQPVYQDIGLTVVHTQPVEANGAGRFPAIYLDPALPNYRILLTDLADVTQPGFPIDDVPSNQNTAQQFRLKHTAPSLSFEETDASANNKIWRIKVNGEQLLLTILNDAESIETTVFTFDRTGTTVDQLDFAGQYLKVNGIGVATQESGSFLGTLTGMSATTTGLITWRRTGTKISLFIGSNIFGTSNSTSMTLTGLPAGLLPATSGGSVLCVVRDNGVNVLGTALIGTASVNFGVGAASGVFTNSGSKGLPGSTTIIYDTDLLGIA